MSVTAKVFPSFNLALAKNAVNPTSDTIYVLLNGSSSAQLGTSQSATTEGITNLASVRSAISEVASGNGYTTGGIQLSGTGGLGTFSVSDSTNVTSLIFSGSSVSWSSATFTAYEAVFYDKSVDQAICWWNFGTPAPSASNGTFTLSMASGNALVTWTS